MLRLVKHRACPKLLGHEEVQSMWERVDSTVLVLDK